MSITSAARPGARALSVSLRDVSRSFAQGSAEPRHVLREIDLEIAPGEIVALLGPSGCGKSTLLRQISGLDAPDFGEVLIDGTALVGIDQRSAIAFQEPRLLPWRSIERNVELGLDRGTPKASGTARVRELLALVGLEGSRQLRPRQISGGMAQRASSLVPSRETPACLCSMSRSEPSTL